MNKKINRLLKGALAFTVAFSTLAVTTSTSRSVSAVEQEESYTQYVDNFMGTSGDHGQLFPGSVVPHGIVKLSPDTTNRTRAGYEYNSDEIIGFSHTRVEGVGSHGAGGDVLVTPTYVEYSKRPDSGSKEQKFAKENGKKIKDASPGYYHTEIVPNTGKDSNYASDNSMGTISAKVTTDVRTGMHSYTFPKEGNVNLLVDMSTSYGGRRSATIDVVKNSDNYVEVSGNFIGNSVCDGTYSMYFYMVLDEPVIDVKTWTNGGATLDSDMSVSGNDVGAVLSFDVDKGETIQAKVSISPISAQQAKIDMQNEVPHWDFEKVRTHADDLWNEVLGKVRIENSKTSDPDNRLKKLFYTNMYHMFMTPVNATSTSGTYRGTDGKLYKADDYTHYDSWTFWDDYRKYSIIGLVDPEFYRDVAKSIADLFETGYSDTGSDNMPVLTVRNEYAVTVLADAVKKGFTDIDNLEIAYEEAVKVADRHMSQRDGLTYGYIDGKIHDTVTACFEYWGVSILAQALGKEDEAQKYAQMALNYKLMFREDAPTEQYLGEQIGILWPKHSPNVENGAWLNCTPDKWQDCGMGQGTLWQYMWYDAYDLNGYIELMGGKENALTVLSYIFGARDENDNGKNMLHSNVNEIDPQLPYIFNFAGKPSETQYWARKIFSKKCWNRYRGDGEFNPPIYDYVYKLEPEGFLTSMDDDCGAMSSMYVSAAMGIFPMTPGDTSLQIGSPFFEKMTLDIGNGKTFTIEANNVSEDNFYIQSATLNGKSFDRSWIDYSEVMNGGTLSFEMGSEPSTWAEDGPTSSSLSDYVTTDIEGDDLIYSGTTFNESKANDGSIGNSVTVKVKNNTFVGELNEDLVATGKIKISNVPEGLTASAIKIAEDTVELKLAGKAVKNLLDDSISNLTIEITDEAIVNPFESNRKIKEDVRVTFSNDTLNYSVVSLKESEANDGSILDTAIIKLTGKTTFAGETSEDFVENGKVSLSNIPQGLTAKVVKVDEQTVILSFEGNADAKTKDTAISVSFNDIAFSGEKASNIKNSTLSGMNAFVLDFIADYREDLNNSINKVETINKEYYTDRSYNELLELVNQGKELLEQEDPDQNLIIQTALEIDEAIVNLKSFKFVDARTKLEGENSDSMSDGLVNESTNLGYTYNGAWFAYDAIDFDIADIKSVGVRHSGSSSCAPEGYLELHLDSIDGDLITTIPLGQTGGWNNYETTSVDIEDISKLNGVHDIYFILVGDTSHDGVANIDYIQFKDGNDTSSEIEINTKKVEFESKSSWSGGNLKTEGSTDSQGSSLTNIGGTYPNAWIKYDQINFDELKAKEIRVRYANNSGRCKPDARLEFYLDSMDGNPFQTVEIPATGSNWNAYNIVTEELETELTGIHDVYVVLRGEEGGNPYIANLDWFEFKEQMPAVDKTELTATYDKYVSLLEDANAYDYRSFVRFKTVINLAKEIIDEKEVTQITIDNTIDLLNRAVTLLNLKTETEVNKTALQAAITTANSLKEQGALDNVVPVVVAEFNSALAEAETVYANDSADQATVDTAFYRLANAIHMLEFVKGDKTDLASLIEEYSKLEETDYTTTSWKVFKDALDDAIIVNEDENALEYEVENALNNLKAGFEQLVVVADKSALQAMVDKVNGLDEDLYTETTWNKLADPMKVANEVLANVDATQDEVNSAYEALVKAYLELRLIPNKDLLEELIKQAQSLEEANYTADSYANLRLALINGQSILANENADEATIKDAVEQLEAGINGLVLVNANNSVSAGDKVVSNGDTTSIATGDNSLTGLFGAVALLSAAGYVALRKKD